MNLSVHGCAQVGCVVLVKVLRVPVPFLLKGDASFYPLILLPILQKVKVVVPVATKQKAYFRDDNTVSCELKLVHICSVSVHMHHYVDMPFSNLLEVVQLPVDLPKKVVISILRAKENSNVVYEINVVGSIDPSREVSLDYVDVHEVKEHVVQQQIDVLLDVVVQIVLVSVLDVVTKVVLVEM